MVEGMYRESATGFGLMTVCSESRGLVMVEELWDEFPLTLRASLSCRLEI
jgi:hypothetical protein